VELSESTLYTILKRLEASSMLTVWTAEHDGRLRKYYRITEAGHRRIEDFKNEWKEIVSIYQFVTKGEEQYA
jgi:PadR family transcriptional regulator PadR